jgi:hypothetical protein
MSSIEKDNRRNGRDLLQGVIPEEKTYNLVKDGRWLVRDLRGINPMLNHYVSTLIYYTVINTHIIPRS